MFPGCSVLFTHNCTVTQADISNHTVKHLCLPLSPLPEERLGHSGQHSWLRVPEISDSNPAEYAGMHNTSQATQYGDYCQEEGRTTVPE